MKLSFLLLATAVIIIFGFGDIVSAQDLPKDQASDLCSQPEHANTLSCREHVIRLEPAWHITTIVAAIVVIVGAIYGAIRWRMTSK
ncbi:hypothetical protein [Flexibacterium corallicola]|uniref:hypothetical protein n=1 Tax=Flexibacterium corallicola TaxID=3037259 RepID=UPI00286ECD3B|nr:hypothetical protein [Pseudovibrio sp. M1P-2-3]